MDMQSKLIQEVMQEAGRRIATIDRNRGLIAKTVALADTINAKTPGEEFSPFICVHEHCVTVDVQARWMTASAVRRAIRAAELVIEREEVADGSSYLKAGDLRFFIAGMDVQVTLQAPADELKAA